MERNYIPLYTLNGFLKFEKRIYQIFRKPLGRPIRLKSIIYAIIIGLIEIIIYFTPIIGNLIRWIPASILIMIPIGLAWLLSDIGTEGRSPFSFFRSFFLYQIRKVKGESAYRGRTVAKLRNYMFHNYMFCIETPRTVSSEMIQKNEEIEAIQRKTIRYLERIQNPDEFFAKLKEEQNRKKRKWLLFRRKE